MGLTFLAFAALQYNDPDALVWFLLYGSAATACLSFPSGRVGIPVLLFSFVLYAGVFAWLSSDLFQAGWIHSEAGRESAGMLIAAVWMLVLVVAARRRRGRWDVAVRRTE
jgi:hypothetical protein